MELEVGGLTGAAYGEKSGERLVQRNGYRERDWEKRAANADRESPARSANASTVQRRAGSSWMAESALPLEASHKRLNQPRLRGLLAPTPSPLE
jgi:hypothetical protein